MPALPPAAGNAKIIIKQTYAGVNVYNILHAQKAPISAWSASELATLASTVRSAWVTNFTPLQYNGLTLNDVTCVDLTSDTGAEGSATGSTPGGLSGSALSSNAAACLTWKIARRYRGGHPRTYVAGALSSHTSNANTWGATYLTAMTSAALALRTAINGVVAGASTVQVGTLHYYRAGVLLATPLVSEYTGVVVDSRVDSQRRRLGRDR
jgi:hypothetical protein